MAGQAKTYTVTLKGGRKGTPKYTRHVDDVSGTTFLVGAPVDDVDQETVDRIQNQPKLLWTVEPTTKKEG